LPAGLHSGRQHGVTLWWLEPNRDRWCYRPCRSALGFRVSAWPIRRDACPVRAAPIGVPPFKGLPRTRRHVMRRRRPGVARAEAGRPDFFLEASGSGERRRNSWSSPPKEEARRSGPVPSRKFCGPENGRPVSADNTIVFADAGCLTGHRWITKTTVKPIITPKKA